MQHQVTIAKTTEVWLMCVAANKINKNTNAASIIDQT